MFNDNYIGIYDNALSEEECRLILNRFESIDKHRHVRPDPSCSSEYMIQKSKDISFVVDSDYPIELSKICTQINFNLDDKEDSFYHKLICFATYNSLLKYH